LWSESANDTSLKALTVSAIARFAKCLSRSCTVVVLLLPPSSSPSFGGGGRLERRDFRVAKLTGSGKYTGEGGGGHRDDDDEGDVGEKGEAILEGEAFSGPEAVLGLFLARDIVGSRLAVLCVVDSATGPCVVDSATGPCFLHLNRCKPVVDGLFPLHTSPITLLSKFNSFAASSNGAPMGPVWIHDAGSLAREESASPSSPAPPPKSLLEAIRAYCTRDP
jgi:hypothetical protein